MQYTESNTEEQLRRQIEELKRQLDEQTHAGGKPKHPSRVALWVIAFILAALIVTAFAAGYIPRARREALIGAEAHQEEQALPVVSVVKAVRSAAKSELELPGSIQAMTEAPILARADGYIKRRYVDIGDRVKQDQLLAELEAPELQEQVDQAKASLQQSQASLEQASANYQQGKANADLAGVTAKRWGNLSAQGVVSRQENDQYQAQYQALLANLQALDKAVNAARSNVAVSQASLSRLESLQGYTMVKAPFAGVITVRNIDVGALVTTGTTLLYRIAQTDTLRTYVNVPQTNSGAVRAGQTAWLSVSNLGGRRFNGTVTRTADSLDPASRTLLTEVQVRNVGGALLPGMYATVSLDNARADPPLLLPSAALVVRADGTQAAVVRPDQTVHFQTIKIGRDYGDRVEVTSGLEDGDSVIVNPGDTVREGVKVNPATGK